MGRRSVLVVNFTFIGQLYNYAVDVIDAVAFLLLRIQLENFDLNAKSSFKNKQQIKWTRLQAWSEDPEPLYLAAVEAGAGSVLSTFLEPERKSARERSWS